MKFKNTSVWGFEHALRGMRNPMNSWSKSDSLFGYCQCSNCGHNHLCDKCINSDENNYAIEAPIIGENDMQLAKKLIKAGTEHRKFMRQIFVSVDITAPLYWWKEYDTYKVGTVANSTSTMHKLTSAPITLNCFETDDYSDLKHDDIKFSNYHIEIIKLLLRDLEGLRQKYLETKDKRYWKELVRWLPESWLQTRTVTLNYENLLAICSKGQRRFHKLNEWSGQDNSELPNFISWARTLPYAQELLFIDETE